MISGLSAIRFSTDNDQDTFIANAWYISGAFTTPEVTVKDGDKGYLHGTHRRTRNYAPITSAEAFMFALGRASKVLAPWTRAPID